MDSFQQIIFKLKHYWAERGCIIQEPYDVEVGAGTMCPETFLRVLGPKPYRVAYVQPSRRPADGRYGENPNRLYKHSQLQVILKPSPDDMIEQYLGSLEAIGIDLRKHDIKFEEDNWESPTLGAWGIGWQVMLDGLEITQFTYFQQCGGIDLDLVPAEMTYGLERLTAFLQLRDSVYDIEWTPGFTYRRRALAGRAAVFGLQLRDGRRRRRYGSCSSCTRARRRGCWSCSKIAEDKARFPLLPAYDQVLKCSNLFNTLDARGAISVTERVAVIARVRKLAVGVAKRGWISRPPGSGGGGMSAPVSARNRHRRDSGLDDSGPRWKVCGAWAAARARAGRGPMDATPRRLVLRAAEVPERQADQEELVQGPAKAAPPKAVEGFARKVGARVEDLQVQSTGKGEYYTFLRKVRAAPPRTFWPRRCPASFRKYISRRRCTGPAKSGPRFIRPIRWIVAMLGDEVVPFEIAGVKSGRVTAGHRRLGAPRSR